MPLTRDEEKNTPVHTHNKTIPW